MESEEILNDAIGVESGHDLLAGDASERSRSPSQSNPVRVRTTDDSRVVFDHPMTPDAPMTPEGTWEPLQDAAASSTEVRLKTPERNPARRRLRQIRGASSSL